MADGKQQNMERNEPDGSKEDLVSSVSTVVSGLAALFLEENFREGHLNSKFRYKNREREFT